MSQESKTVKSFGFNLGDWSTRQHSQVVDISNLPLKQQSQKDNGKLLHRQHFTQALCHHCNKQNDTINTNETEQFDCALHYNSFNEHQEWFDFQANQWNLSDRLNKTLILAQLFHWNENSRTSSWSGDSNEGTKHRYPRNYTIIMWNPDGRGCFKICLNYLCFILQCGQKGLRTLVSYVWQSRNAGLLLPQTLDGYQGAVSEWIDYFEQWLPNSRFKLLKNHYINRQSDRLYFDNIDGSQVTWEKVWEDFIQEFDSIWCDNEKDKQKWKEWQDKGCKPETKPFVHEPPDMKPFPSKKYFIETVKKKYNIGLKRVGKDTCTICNGFNTALCVCDDTEQKQEIKAMLVLHQQLANDTYDIVHHSKQGCIELWQNTELKKYSFLDNPNKTIHFEADFCHSNFEYDSTVQDAHYKSQVLTNAFNAVRKPEKRYSMLWSEKDGNKNKEEFLTCLNKLFTEESLGAGRCVVSMDGCNTNVNQFLLKYFHWITFYKNPNRIFLSLLANIFQRGHNYCEPDGIGAKKEGKYKQRTKFRNTADRVKYLKDCKLKNITIRIIYCISK